MSDTTITTPAPETATPAPASNIDAAVAAIETPAPAAAPAAPELEPSVDQLAKLDPAEIDRMLTEGTQTVEKPAVVTPPAATETTPPPAQAEEGEDANAMIPRARLNQEIQKRKDLEVANAKLAEERAYLAGRADAAATPSLPAQPQEDPEKVILQNLQTLARNYNEAQIKLAEKFDSGDLSAKQWKEQEQSLQAASQKLQDQFTGQLHEVRTAKRTPDPKKVTDDINSHPGLQAKTAEIMTANPWMASIPGRLQPELQAAAQELLDSHMITLPSNPTMQDLVSYSYDLRLAMVDVAKSWGFGPKEAPAPTPTPGAGGAPATTTTPQVTSDQIRSKLELAKAQPPISTMAGTPLPTNALAGIPKDSMSVDDLAKLPAKELAALIEQENRKGQAA